MRPEREQDDAHRDQRGSEPPADDSQTADADSEGPQGNPEVDEEALQHRQQESG